jgi:hypothetical protein
MSVFDENIPPFTAEGRIDLLVDGELSEADRRALLLQLEHDPDGWRRCALAFLEAQCWKTELGQLAPPAAAVRAAPVSQTEPATSQLSAVGRWQRWRQYAATSLTIAASFLIALVVGMGLGGNKSGGLSNWHGPLNATVQETPLSNPAQSPSPAVAPGGSIAQGPGTANDWEMVTLAGRSSDGQAETYRVPAQNRDTFDQNMLNNVPNFIPPALQQVFEQSGHRVVQQREIVPVQMNDGRRLVVPVDHVEIHYVGRPSL